MKKILKFLIMFLLGSITISNLAIFVSCQNNDERKHATIILYEYLDEIDGWRNNIYCFTEEKPRMEISTPYDGRRRLYDTAIKFPDGSFYGVDTDFIKLYFKFYNVAGEMETKSEIRDRGKYEIEINIKEDKNLYSFNPFLILTIY